MYIASATTRTGYVARGIAGKEAASCVHSHQTAASDILFGGHFYVLKALADYYKIGEISKKSYGTFSGKELKGTTSK